MKRWIEGKRNVGGETGITTPSSKACAHSKVSVIKVSVICKLLSSRADEMEVNSQDLLWFCGRALVGGDSCWFWPWLYLQLIEVT